MSLLASPALGIIFLWPFFSNFGMVSQLIDGIEEIGIKGVFETLGDS